MLRGLLRRSQRRHEPARSPAYTHVLAWIPDPLNDTSGYWDLADQRAWESGEPPDVDTPLLLLGSGAPQAVLTVWVRAVLGTIVDLVPGSYELAYDIEECRVWHREPLFYVYPVLPSGVGS